MTGSPAAGDAATRELILVGGGVRSGKSALALARRRALETPFHAVLVTDEVGMGVVPDGALGRRFRDASGRAHGRLAPCATRIYLAALGCILRLRPGPVALVTPGGEEHP